MSKLLQPFENIIFRASIHPSLIIIPIQMNSQIQAASPVLAEGIMLLDRKGKVLNILPANVFNPEIVHG